MSEHRIAILEFLLKQQLLIESGQAPEPPAVGRVNRNIFKENPMKLIPETKNALVLRTEYSDPESWNLICDSIRKPIGEFRAYVDFLSDREYEGIVPEKILTIIPQNYQHRFIFIVDNITFSHIDNPILVVDLLTEPGRIFRVIPSEMWGVENNLSIANMNFAEFADHVDKDGIFRGFPDI